MLAAASAGNHLQGNGGRATSTAGSCSSVWGDRVHAPEIGVDKDRSGRLRITIDKTVPDALSERSRN